MERKTRLPSEEQPDWVPEGWLLVDGQPDRGRGIYMLIATPANNWAPVGAVMPYWRGDQPTHDR